MAIMSTQPIAFGLRAHYHEFTDSEGKIVQTDSASNNYEHVHQLKHGGVYYTGMGNSENLHHKHPFHQVLREVQRVNVSEARRLQNFARGQLKKVS